MAIESFSKLITPVVNGTTEIKCKFKYLNSIETQFKVKKSKYGVCFDWQ